MDQIALVINTLQVPEKFKDYFHHSFKYARYIIEKEKDPRQRREKEDFYKDILQICKTKGWEPVNEDPGAG